MLMDTYWYSHSCHIYIKLQMQAYFGFYDVASTKYLILKLLLYSVKKVNCIKEPQRETVWHPHHSLYCSKINPRNRLYVCIQQQMCNKVTNTTLYNPMWGCVCVYGTALGKSRSTTLTYSNIDLLQWMKQDEAEGARSTGGGRWRK